MVEILLEAYRQHSRWIYGPGDEPRPATFQKDSSISRTPDPSGKITGRGCRLSVRPSGKPVDVLNHLNRLFSMGGSGRLYGDVEHLDVLLQSRWIMGQLDRRFLVEVSYEEMSINYVSFWTVDSS